jgi:hypothetical protein
MLTLITLLQLVIFTAYIVYIKQRFGKLTSISASTYSFTGNDRWFFLAFLWSIAILNLFQGMEVWGFFTSVGLIFTGLTIDHDGSFKTENRLHTIAAVLAIVIGAFGMLFVHGMLFPVVVILIAGLTLYNNKYFIWDIEVIAFYTILFSYLLR